MASCRETRLALQEALTLILDTCSTLPAEEVALDRASGRIAACSLCSTIPKPAFSQATRDGYALGAVAAESGKQTVFFRLTGEIAAGSTHSGVLEPGTAVRIMTGAMVPSGCRMVVPYEICAEEEGRVMVPRHACTGGITHIRRRGSELAAGAGLVTRGERLVADRLALLAESGYVSLPVHRRVRVAILCTGSELVRQGGMVGRGQKISTNSILLTGLIQAQGGEIATEPLTVGDDRQTIGTALLQLADAKPDLLLTTGGMGPGKFDLMEEVFSGLGSTILYDRLAVRPGKSTMFGLLNHIPFFSLPGPPPAVRILFHELVAPALRKMGGQEMLRPRTVKATLTESITMKEDSWLSLKGGVAWINRAGKLFVRIAGSLDRVNAILLLEREGRAHLAPGRQIPVHLVAEPEYSQGGG